MRKVLILLLLPTLLLASTHSGNGYDITPRVINFLIFAAICYYLLANPLKNMYKNRIASIANELDAIQEKLINSKNKKQALVRKIDEAKIEASNIINLSKEEAKLLVKKIQSQLEHEIASLDKAQENKKEFEIKRLKKELSAKILDELFANKQHDLTHEHVLDIVFKKVS